MEFRKLFVLPVAAGLLFTGCSFGDSETVNVESALLADTQMVMSFNGAGSNYDDFKELLERFPSLESLGSLEESMDEKDKELFEDLAEVFEEEFKVVVGIDNYTVTEVQPTADFVAAMYFEKADLFEDTFTALLENGGVAFDMDTVDGVKYFTSVVDDLFAARTGDVFVFAMNEEALDVALRSYLDGEGFVPSEEFDNALGYFYVNKDFFGAMSDEVYGFDAGALLSDTYMWFEAKDKGLAFHSASEINADSEGVDLLFGNTDYKADMVDKIRAGDVMMFAEQGNLKQYVELVSFSMVNSLASVDPTLVSEGWGEDFIGELAGLFGLDQAEFDSMMDNSFALVMSDSGMMYPSMAFYLNLDGDDLDAAKKVTTQFDQWLDQVIVLYDGMAQQNGVGVGALKKEVELVGGNGLHKLYFDMDAVRDELAPFTAFVPGLDLEKLRLEFYYGVANDEMFVAALHPDFPEMYSNGTVVSEGEAYKKAIGELTLTEGYATSYFATAPLISMVDRWVELAEGSGYVTEENMANYELIMKDFVGTVVSAITVNAKEGNSIVSEGFVVIE